MVVNKRERDHHENMERIQSRLQEANLPRECQGDGYEEVAWTQTRRDSLRVHPSVLLTHVGSKYLTKDGKLIYFKDGLQWWA